MAISNEMADEWATKLRQLRVDLAAEVKRLTAELAEAKQKCEHLQREAVTYAQEARTQSGIVRECYAAVGAGQLCDWHGAQPIRDKINTLTARVAELESGSAFVGEEYHPQEWEIYWEEFRGKLRLAEFGSGSLSEQCERIRYRYTGPTTAPLPTAGDEGEVVGQKVVERLQDAVDEPDFAGMAARRMIEIAEREGKPGQSTSEAVMDWLGRQIDENDEDPAPAEPDSPAEERPLDAIPPLVTLLRIKAGYGMRQFAERAGLLPSRWSEIERGRVRPTDMELCRILVALSDSPIHHDPTDAAAVELRERIEEGGGE